jgi:hypothetical protein
MASLRDKLNKGYQEGLNERTGAGGNGRQAQTGKKPPRSAGPDGTGKADERPTIHVTTDEHLVNDQAVTALAREPDIYQRLGQLVRVVQDAEGCSAGIRRPAAPRIEPLPIPILRESLARCARWKTKRDTKDGPTDRAVHVPEWCVAAVHARGNWPGVRPLEAVIGYPVLKPDGTVLCKAGYDPDTGLLLAARKPPPAVPDSPSRAEAIAAKEELLRVVSDFPFQNDYHRAAWLAALLTPLSRFAFSGPAPLFLVDANVRGAGKGLLLNVISHILTGVPFTTATYTPDCEELRKRITSLALSGDREALFDNLEGRFGNQVLDAALTATAWKDRLLNSNKTADVPLNVTWYATGNNVVLAGDMFRRVCHIRLESGDERPEERKGFQRPKLLAWVREHRGQLLKAALVILRAYCEAGRPDMGLSPWGSFEAWSDLVRSAVAWVGLPDPSLTRQALRENADADLAGLVVLMDAMQQLDPHGRGLTAAEMIEVYGNRPLDFPERQHSEFRDALADLLPKPDTRSLGALLKRRKRQVIDGRYIDKTSTVDRAGRWAVCPADTFSH